MAEADEQALRPRTSYWDWERRAAAAGSLVGSLASWCGGGAEAPRILVIFSLRNWPSEVTKGAFVVPPAAAALGAQADNGVASRALMQRLQTSQPGGGRSGAPAACGGGPWLLLYRGCSARMALAWALHVLVGTCAWLLLLQFVLITAEEEMASHRLSEAAYLGQLARDFAIAVLGSLLLSEVFKVATRLAPRPQPPPPTPPAAAPSHARPLAPLSARRSERGCLRRWPSSLSSRRTCSPPSQPSARRRGARRCGSACARSPEFSTSSSAHSSRALPSSAPPTAAQPSAAIPLFSEAVACDKCAALPSSTWTWTYHQRVSKAGVLMGCSKALLHLHVSSSSRRVLSLPLRPLPKVGRASIAPC